MNQIANAQVPDMEAISAAMGKARFYLDISRTDHGNHCMGEKMPIVLVYRRNASGQIPDLEAKVGIVNKRDSTDYFLSIFDDPYNPNLSWAEPGAVSGGLRGIEESVENFKSAYGIP